MEIIEPMVSHAARTKALHDLFDFIRRFQRVSGFGIRSYGKGVSQALKDHVLNEICTRDHININKLITILNVPQPTVSRAIRDLIRSKFIYAVAQENDRRSRLLYPTEQGQEIFYQNNFRSNCLYHKMASGLAPKEVKELLMLQEKFANLLGAYPASSSTAFHPMRKNTLRITHALRLLRNDLLLDYSISLLGWHFLYDIGQAGIASKELIAIYSAPPNTVASVLKQLKNVKAVKLKSAKSDRRIQLISLTERGRFLMTKVISDQVATNCKKLAAMTTLELVKLKNLSEKLLLDTNSSDGEHTLMPRLTMRLLNKPADLSTAHQYINYHSSISLQHNSEQYDLSDKNTATIGMFQEDILVGVALFRINSVTAKLLKILMIDNMSNNISKDQFSKACEQLLARMFGSGNFESD